jgi:hypothetical protein
MNFNNLNNYASTTKIQKIFYKNEQLALTTKLNSFTCRFKREIDDYNQGIGWTHALMFTHKYCDVPRNKREETT